MQVVQGDTIEWKRGLEYRGGMFHFRKLLEGTPGTIDNFQLSMGRSSKDFLSPRHRHNFEQIRISHNGKLKFGRDGELHPGIVGYFPEGAHYGPQTQDDEATAFVLQFGGASGSGYLCREEVVTGMQALESTGTFKDGIFRRNEGEEGKRNVDAYQAIWEELRGRKLEYPKPRYPGPVFMDESHFNWVPSPTQKGVAEKMLGVFTERGTVVGLLRVDAGATATLPERSVHICASGKGKIAGEAGGHDVREITVIHTAAGETATITADEDCLFYRMTLPDLTGLEEGSTAGQAVAAE